jgi:hypothetical protein
MRWIVHVAGIGEKKAYRFLVGRPEEKYNIKMDLVEI